MFNTDLRCLPGHTSQDKRKNKFDENLIHKCYFQKLICSDLKAFSIKIHFFMFVAKNYLLLIHIVENANSERCMPHLTY